jgi:hypothetical protein
VYDPAIGRFLSVDPVVRDVGAAQSWNGYGYVEGRVTSWTDPSGWFGVPLFAIGNTKFRNDPPPIPATVPTAITVTARKWNDVSAKDYSGFWGGSDISAPAGERADATDPPQSPQAEQVCTSTDFDFGQFSDQVEDNRFNLGATLGTLIATGAIGTMPKTPSELRGLGVPKSELNPITSQLSRWSDKLDTRWMRDIGRTTGGRLVSGAATLGVVFEGFYDIGVIGNAAWDARPRTVCGP